MFYMQLLFIVFAVSFDSFTVGLAFGVKQIKVSILALAMLMLCSAIVVYTSMTIGTFIEPFFPELLRDMLGSIVFIVLGGVLLFTHTNHQGNERTMSLLRKPQKADVDKSKTISMKEAFFLGTALALDAFGAGFGAAMIGYAATMTAIFVGIMSGLLLYIGLLLGRILGKTKTMTRLSFLPPVILLSIGVYGVIKVMLAL
ncbi:MAG TPA: sporulation membrane protein YtaF [Pseudogracilibacillus sp.]|nr:sporulation membrane protein YtaF [Pseudogracilibacillus sp.]